MQNIPPWSLSDWNALEPVRGAVSHPFTDIPQFLTISYQGECSSNYTMNECTCKVIEDSGDLAFSLCPPLPL